MTIENPPQAKSFGIELGTTVFFPRANGKVEKMDMDKDKFMTPEQTEKAREFLHECLLSPADISAPQLAATMYAVRVSEIHNTQGLTKEQCCTIADDEVQSVAELVKNDGFSTLTTLAYEKMTNDAHAKGKNIPALTKLDGKVADLEEFQVDTAYVMLQDLSQNKGTKTNTKFTAKAALLLTETPEVRMDAFNELLSNGAIDAKTRPVLMKPSEYITKLDDNQQTAFTTLSAIIGKSYSAGNFANNAGVSWQIITSAVVVGKFLDKGEVDDSPAPTEEPAADATKPGKPPVSPSGETPALVVTVEKEKGQANIVIRRIAQVLVYGSAVYSATQAMKGNRALMEKISPSESRGKLKKFLFGTESVVFSVSSAAYAFRLAREASRRIEESENAREVARNAALIVGSAAVLYTGQWLYKNNYGRDTTAAQMLAQVPTAMGAFYTMIRERISGKKSAATDGAPAATEAPAAATEAPAATEAGATTETTAQSAVRRVNVVLRNAWLYSNVLGQAATFTGLLKEFVPSAFRETPFVKNTLDRVDTAAEWVEDSAGNLEGEARGWFIFFQALERELANADNASIYTRVGHVMWSLSQFARVPRDDEQVKIAAESDAIRTEVKDTISTFTSTGVWTYGDPAKRKAANDAAAKKKKK